LPISFCLHGQDGVFCGSEGKAAYCHLGTTVQFLMRSIDDIRHYGSPPGSNTLLCLFQVTPQDTLVFAVLDTQRIRGIA